MEITGKKGRPVAREGAASDTAGSGSPKDAKKEKNSTGVTIVKASDSKKGNNGKEDPDSKAKKVADNKSRMQQLERKGKKGKGEKFEKAKSTENSNIFFFTVILSY